MLQQTPHNLDVVRLLQSSRRKRLAERVWADALRQDACPLASRFDAIPRGLPREVLAHASRAGARKAPTTTPCAAAQRGSRCCRYCRAADLARLGGDEINTVIADVHALQREHVPDAQPRFKRDRKRQPRRVAARAIVQPFDSCFVQISRLCQEKTPFL